METKISNDNIQLFGAWLFLLIHIQFTPSSEKPKNHVSSFFKKLDHEIRNI